MAKNFPCPGCNADLEWSAGQGDLTCPYCGHVHKDSAVAVGYRPHTHALDALDQALQAAPGWGEARKELRCGSCGATSEVEPHIEATACTFCGSPQLDAQSGGAAVLRPDAVAPFAIEKNEAIRRFRAWLGGLWFRPSGLKEMASLGNLSGAYLPAWCLDASTQSRWRAERGHHYWEDEEVRGADGKTEVRRVQKTRWEPASGHHAQDFQDVMVIASKGLDQSHLQELQPFDLGRLGGYDARFLQGFVAERYQIGLDEGYTQAQAIMQAAVRAACAREVGGDTHRNLDVDTDFLDPRFKLLLLPIWIAAYQYGGKSYRFLVNGQSGKATGTAPYSTAKIVLFILAVLAVIGVLAALFGGQ